MFEHKMLNILATEAQKAKDNISVIIKDSEGRILVQDHVKNNNITIVSGGLDEPETPVECAAREVGEETGLMVSTDELELVFSDTLTYPNQPELTSVHYMFALRRVVKHNEVSNIEPEKHRSMFWWDPKDGIPDNPSVILSTMFKEKAHLL